MSMQVLFKTVEFDGSEKLYASAAEYVAGMPCKITANGLDVALNPDQVCGLFKNDKFDDVKAAPSVGDTVDSSDLRASRTMSFVKVSMTTGKKSDGTTTAPFVWPGTAHAWADGDLLYVNASGKWDNAPTDSGDPNFGYVIEAPASATGVMVADIDTSFKGGVL